MPFYTDEQLYERSLLRQALETVTKVEPEQWAKQIHDYIRFFQEDGYSVNEIMDGLEKNLSTFCVEACTGGNNFEGWRDRTVFLSEKQQKSILMWINFAFKIGGRFSENPPEEDQ